MSTRRTFLQNSIATVGVSSIGFASFAMRADRPTVSAEALAAHALNRLGYGPRPGDIRSVASDPRGWALAQCASSAEALPAALTGKLEEARFASMDPVAVLREFSGLQQDNPNVANVASAAGADLSPVGRFAREQQRPAYESRLWRALESPHQLNEVMVDFWFNHFNVFQGKNQVRVLVGHYEHHAIRPHAMGSFRDLLGATAHHPAMLVYLDNWQSAGPSAQGNRGLNENYARELMELHTLGVDAGYTQADVTQLARMLTGWTVVPFRGRAAAMTTAATDALPPSAPNATPGFWFNPRMHDAGEKHWLAQRVEVRGKDEGDLALDVLARHPATARNIAFKLAQYFVADRPHPALVDRLAQVFTNHDGQILPVLRSLFESDDFWATENVGTKFKTPYHYTLSALRAGGYGVTRVQSVLGTLAAQGMPLYGCLTPDGYTNTEAAWLNPDGMSKRINVATQLGNGRLGGERLSGGLDVDTLMAQLGPLVTPSTRDVALQHRQEPGLALALLLAGPGMMRR